MLSNLYKVKIRSVALFVYSSRIEGDRGHEYRAMNISDIREYRAYSRKYHNSRENYTTKIVKMPRNILSQQNIGAPICLAYA